ncbi:hypothetical protein [Thalassiella azotivora]
MRPDAPRDAPAGTRPDARRLTGLHLRALLATTAVLALLVALTGAPEPLDPWTLVLSTLIVAGTTLAPASLVPTAFLLLVAAGVLFRGDAGPVQLVLLAALLHAVHLLASLCALGTPRTAYEPAALVPSLRRWALAQVVVLPVAVTAALVADDAAGGLPDAVLVAAGLGALAVVVGTVALGRRRVR